MSAKGMLTSAVSEQLASAAAPQTPNSAFGSTDRTLKSVSSPDLASHKLNRIGVLAERGRDAQRHDSEWTRAMQKWESHKQKLDEGRRRLVSSRQRDSARRAHESEEREAAATTRQRRAMLRTLNEQNAERAELARQADEDTSTMRHRRHLEHQDYLARMRREAARRAQETQRANEGVEQQMRLASARSEQHLRDKVEHAAAERRAYEERRKQVDERGRQAKLRRNAEEEAELRERQRQTSERLAQLSSRMQADSQGKARRHDGYMAAASQTLREALATQQEMAEARYALASAKSESQLSSYRAAQDDFAREYQARYNANREGGARRLAAMRAERDRDIRTSLSTKQARLDDLYHRRAVRDSEVAAHTASQLLMSHALCDAEWRLLVKSDFTPDEVGRQLSSAQSAMTSGLSCGSVGGGSRGGLSSRGSSRPPSRPLNPGAAAAQARLAKGVELAARMA